MIVDTHCHAFPGAYLDRLPSQSANVRGVPFRRFDADEYIAVMDRHRVSVGVLSNQAAQIETLGDPLLAIELARALNDGLIEGAIASPDRFRSFVRLPMLETDAALAELDRIAGAPGVVGVCSPTNVAGRYLDEPWAEPIWRALADRSMPLFLHPTYAPCSAKWDLYALKHKLLWPVDTTLALSRIVYSGVLDRHPVTIIAAHLGGVVLQHLDRLNWREGGVACVDEPEAYFRHFYYDIAGPSRAGAVEMAVATVGAEQLLFGSDYPHGRGGAEDAFYSLAQAAIDEARISDREREMICAGNAAALLRIGA
jgi:aminocarboxymuconate-semialdehyde decarboxylase